jgi:outer membrane protein assembly factor BamD
MFVISKLSGRGPILALLLAASAIGLSGCSTFKKKHKTDLSYVERPVDVLYAAGADKLDRHQWPEAVDYFREVERQHPYSEWARRAILMTAYAHYENGDYAEAIGDADRFISLYPGNSSAPYAYYLKSVCYFEQIIDVGRDQAATEQALSSLKEITRRFPRTQYASDARLKIDMVNDQLAGKEMSIGRFYQENAEPVAAMSRFKDVIDRYQTTSHTPEALYRLVVLDLTLGLSDDAKRNAAVLGANFPGDRWYADAYKLMVAKGLRPAVEPQKQHSLPEKLHIG